MRLSWQQHKFTIWHQYKAEEKPHNKKTTRKEEWTLAFKQERVNKRTIKGKIVKTFTNRPKLPSVGLWKRLFTFYLIVWLICISTAFCSRHGSDSVYWLCNQWTSIAQKYIQKFSIHLRHFSWLFTHRFIYFGIYCLT